MLAYISASALKVDRNWGELSFPGFMSLGSMYFPKVDDLTNSLCLLHSEALSLREYPNEYEVGGNS